MTRFRLLACLVAFAVLPACDDEEAFPPPNTPSNDMGDMPPPPPSQAGPPADSSATSPQQPPVGTPQPLGQAWVVPFPDEAAREGVTRADVVLLVTVAPSGAVEDAAVVADPGHGFGEAAKSYAMGQRFKPAIDATGAAVRATTRVRVSFRR